MHVKEITTNLWSVVLPGETTDEWDKLMEQWHNPYYLHNFFSERVSYLRYFKLDVEQAIRAVVDECYQIEDIILEGRFDRDFFFKPLDKEQKEIIEFQLNKGKLTQLDRPSLLRLYAIKLPEDVYILTGGAIKLTRKMQEAENTNSELIKMKNCRDFFRQNNILSIKETTNETTKEIIMKTINEKLKAFQLDSPSSWKEKAEWRKKNKAWLKKSQYVAIKVITYLRDNDLSQKYLAERLQVSPQQISKILKGTENLTLETISNLESVLNIQLFPTDIRMVKLEVDYSPLQFKTSDMAPIGKPFREYQSYNANFSISPQQLTCSQIPS